MHELRRRLLLNAFRASDVVLVLAAFTLAFVVSGKSSPLSLSEFFAMRIKLSNFLIIAALTLVWHVIFSSCGLYRSRRFSNKTPEGWDITKAVLLGTLTLSAMALVFNLTAVNRAFIGTFFLTALVGTLVSRHTLRLFLGELRRRGRNLRNLVIVGCGPRGARIGSEARTKPELGYLLLGYIDDMEPPVNPLHGRPEKLLGPLGDAVRILNELNVDEVFISLPLKSHYPMIATLVTVCTDMGVIVRIPVDFFEARIARANVDYLHDLPIVTLETQTPPLGGLVFKRGIDVVLSMLALVVLTPLFVLTALIIKLASPGPVLFIQDRVGLGRRPFRMVKFRTMIPGAQAKLAELESQNEADGAAFKMLCDPRVTRVGRVLRKLSIDELPQFWNVLKGEMSVVGPRPLPARDVARLDRDWQRRRFTVKPGLTCLWQVNGRHQIGFDHWMEMDLQYIDNWSLKLDLEIIYKTIPAIIRGTGAS